MNMNAMQWTCLCLLALAASQSAQGASIMLVQDNNRPLLLDDGATFDQQIVWQSPELPYMRLLADRTAPRAHWSLAEHPSATTPSATFQPAHTVQALPVAAEVPEASMVSMLLVGLGLLALSAHGERQEKFQEAPRPHL